MKKLLAGLLSTTLVLGMLAGCGAKPAAPTATPTAAPTAAPTVAPATGLKTGLAILPTLKGDSATAEKAGKAEGTAVVVAVNVDEKGVITDCLIDEVESKVEFSTQGKITTDLTAALKTKQELGGDYGMKKASAIGKEWNEQMDALSTYVVGKTIEDVKGIAITDKGVAGDADLAASVSLHLGGFISAIETAVANAAPIGAQPGDKLSLGIVTELNASKDASADKDGVTNATSSIAVTSLDASGKITGCLIDMLELKVKFNAVGAITSDLTAPLLTKNQFGADYGMAKASSIGKEWNQQAEAFAASTIGKTAAEVGGIAVNAEGQATDADLVATVTLRLGEFQPCVVKAASK